MKRSFAGLFSFFLLGCGTMPVSSQSDPAQTETQAIRANAEVAPRLINLLTRIDQRRRDPRDFQETALRDLVTLTTPAGYRVKNRYLEMGVPLAQALSFSQDEQLRQRLVEAARWTNNPRARSEALIGLAKLKNP
ncbi:MAG: hypothetical protein HY548_05190, partial [Elusimicrobia bacterium]|nr:hypothetical protein [Elusimicrobiota bacterium]